MADITKSKIRQLDFTLLLVMQGLLRHRRTVDVAEELGLSQPAISHALRRLRHIFDDPLFIRRPHGMEPTHHALGLASTIDQIMLGAGEAIGLGSQFDAGTTTRQFRIGVPEHLASLVAAPLLSAFAREAPSATFILRTEIGESALRAVHHDQLDLALGQFKKVDPGLRSEFLYEDRYALVLRRSHPDATSRVTRALLSRLSWISVSPAGDPRAFTDADFDAQQVHRAVVATMPRFQTAFEAVRQSDKAVVAPARLAQAFAGAFRLVVRKLPVDLHPIRVMLVRRKHPDSGIDWLAGVCREVTGN